MWQRQYTELFERRIKQYYKNHPEEVECCLANLADYIDCLNTGLTVYQLRNRGYVHSEVSGTWAIDESNRKLKTTRIYFYPDETTKTIYLITIGDKQSQRKTDIPECKRFMKMKK